MYALVLQIFRKKCLLCFIVLLLVINNNSLIEAQENIHYRTLFDNTFKFNDTPSEMQYVTKLSIDDLKNNIMITDIIKDKDHLIRYIITVDFGGEKIVKYRLRYNIYTNIADTELAAISSSINISFGMKNSIDYPLNEKIGDNCWYASTKIFLVFTKNNVRVNITTDDYDEEFRDEEIFVIAKLVDELISSSEKVYDPATIPAPVINSIEIISGNFELYTVTILKVEAFDPNGQKLRYLRLGNPLGTISEDGTVLFHNTPVKDQSYMKILVENEDFITSSYDYYFTPSSVEPEDTAAEAPQVFELFQNAPNPFNPTTAIRYILYEPGIVDLRIYDQLGREVAAFAEGYHNAGSHEVVWDGRDENGNRVSSGIYFYTMSAGGKKETKRMVMVR